MRANVHDNHIPPVAIDWSVPIDQNITISVDGEDVLKIYMDKNANIHLDRGSPMSRADFKRRMGQVYDRLPF